MAEPRSTLRETANDPFRGAGESGTSPFSTSLHEPANEDHPETQLAIDRVEDLIIDLGNGNEEAVAYKTYTGSSLIRKGAVLVVRFATRHVFVEGARLKAVRDAVSNKRCALLRISSRTDLINAQKDGKPVITALRVVKPKAGETELNAVQESTPEQESLSL